MSTVPDGRYYIVNRVLSDSGQDLAMSFQGVNQYTLTANLNKTDTNQVWVVMSAFGKKAVSPANNTNLQIGWGADGAIVLNPNAYVWTITNLSNQCYTIQDGGMTAFWGLDNVATGQHTHIIPGSATDWTRQWILIPA